MNPVLMFSRTIQEESTHYVHTTQGKPATRLKSLATIFATTVGRNEYSKSAAFMENNPQLFKEEDREAKYLDEAVRRLNADDREGASSFVEKYIFIDETLKDARFLARLRNKDKRTITSFKEKFQAIFQGCQARVAPSSKTALPHRRLHDPVVEPGISRQGNISEVRPRAHSGSTMDSTGFASLPPTQWHWFKVGRVFLWRTYREDNTINDDISSQGGTLIPKIRPMVVVRLRDGWFHAVSVVSYGGLGLKKPGLRDSNIQAHAIIHLEGTEAEWLYGEPHSAKRPIAVECSSNSSFAFHSASRVDFEKTWPINYNERIKKIGMVTQRCLPYLELYWVEELSKKQGNNKGQNRHGSLVQSSQVAPEDQQSRHTIQQGSQTQQGRAKQESIARGQQGQYQSTETRQSRHSVQQVSQANQSHAMRESRDHGQLNLQDQVQSTGMRRIQYEVEPKIQPRSGGGHAQQTQYEGERDLRLQYEEDRAVQTHHEAEQAPRRQIDSRAAARGQDEGERAERTRGGDDHAQRPHRQGQKRRPPGLRLL